MSTFHTILKIAGRVFGGMLAIFLITGIYMFDVRNPFSSTVESWRKYSHGMDVTLFAPRKIQQGDVVHVRVVSEPWREVQNDTDMIISVLVPQGMKVVTEGFEKMEIITKMYHPYRGYVRYEQDNIPTSGLFLDRVVSIEMEQWPPITDQKELRISVDTENITALGSSQLYFEMSRDNTSLRVREGKSFWYYLVPKSDSIYRDFIYSIHRIIGVSY